MIRTKQFGRKPRQEFNRWADAGTRGEQTESRKGDREQKRGSRKGGAEKGTFQNVPNATKLSRNLFLGKLVAKHRSRFLHEGELLRPPLPHAGLDATGAGGVEGEVGDGLAG
jgi:hypothetical protein